MNVSSYKKWDLPSTVFLICNCKVVTFHSWIIYNWLFLYSNITKLIHYRMNKITFHLIVQFIISSLSLIQEFLKEVSNAPPLLLCCVNSPISALNSIIWMIREEELIMGLHTSDKSHINQLIFWYIISYLRLLSFCTSLY